MIFDNSEVDRVAGKKNAQQVSGSEPPSTFEEFLKKERLVCINSVLPNYENANVSDLFNLVKWFTEGWHMDM